METKRNIQVVVKQVSFAEAEEADNLYWSQASYEERLSHLFMLRSIQFGNELKRTDRIEKVVTKRKLRDEE
jgi:hypothetical protein